jgi:hypothetical protein
MWTGVGEGSVGATRLPLLNWEAWRHVISGPPAADLFRSRVVRWRHKHGQDGDDAPGCVVVDGGVGRGVGGPIYKGSRDLADEVAGEGG